MSKTLPPLQKVRHLRLVPPLPPLPEPEGCTSGATARGPGAPEPFGLVLLAEGHSAVPMWLRYSTLTLAGTLTLLALCGYLTGIAPPTSRMSGIARGAPGTGPHNLGPSIKLYAREPEGPALGRPLQDGDPLYASDHLVLGIHNAPGVGIEAAQFAAVFAVDAERHIAALYPALGAEAVAMPLPQVASMALLDGPQLAFGEGAVTLVAVFLRRQVPLGPLMEALGAQPIDNIEADALGSGLQDAVVRLQRVTVTHGGAPGHTSSSARPR